MDGDGLFSRTSASASTRWILLTPKVELPRKKKAGGGREHGGVTERMRPGAAREPKVPKVQHCPVRRDIHAFGRHTHNPKHYYPILDIPYTVFGSLFGILLVQNMLLDEARNFLHKFTGILLGQPVSCPCDLVESNIVCKLLGLRLEPLSESAGFSTSLTSLILECSPAIARTGILSLPWASMCFRKARRSSRQLRNVLKPARMPPARAKSFVTGNQTRDWVLQPLTVIDVGIGEEAAVVALSSIMARK